MNFGNGNWRSSEGQGPYGMGAHVTEPYWQPSPTYNTRPHSYYNNHRQNVSSNGGPLIVELDVEQSSARSSPLRSGRSAAYTGGTSRKLKQRRHQLGFNNRTRLFQSADSLSGASCSQPYPANQQPAQARPWHQVNKDVSARMMAATSDSPPLIPKRDYQQNERISTAGSQTHLKGSFNPNQSKPASECHTSGSIQHLAPPSNHHIDNGSELETQQHQMVVYEGGPDPFMHQPQYGDFAGSTFAPGTGPGTMMPADQGNMLMPLGAMHLQPYMMPPPPMPMPFMGMGPMMEQPPPFMPHLPPPYSMPPPMGDPHMAMMSLPPKHPNGMLPAKSIGHGHGQGSAEHTCYVLCCKGHTQVLWIVVGIILSGVILGVVLGLTLIDDETYSQ